MKKLQRLFSFCMLLLWFLQPSGISYAQTETPTGTEEPTATDAATEEPTATATEGPTFTPSPTYESLIKSPTPGPTNWYQCNQSGAPSDWLTITPSGAWDINCSNCLLTATAQTTMTPTPVNYPTITPGGWFTGTISPTITMTPSPSPTIAPTVANVPQIKYVSGLPILAEEQYYYLKVGGSKSSTSFGSYSNWVTALQASICHPYSVPYPFDYHLIGTITWTDVVRKSLYDGTITLDLPGTSDDVTIAEYPSGEGGTKSGTQQVDILVTDLYYGSGSQCKTATWQVYSYGFTEGEVSFVGTVEAWRDNYPVPTSEPTATPTDVAAGSYCSEIGGNGYDPSVPSMPSLPDIRIGPTECSGIEAFAVPMDWVPVLELPDLIFPGLQVCFREIIFPTVEVLNVSFDLNYMAYVIGAIAILRMFLRS